LILYRPQTYEERVLKLYSKQDISFFLIPPGTTIIDWFLSASIRSFFYKALCPYEISEWGENYFGELS